MKKVIAKIIKKSDMGDKNCQKSVEFFAISDIIRTFAADK